MNNSLNTKFHSFRLPGRAFSRSVAVLAIAAVALAITGGMTTAAIAAASPSVINLVVTETAGSVVNVDFTGGLGSITNQDVVGTSMLATTTALEGVGILAGSAQNSGNDFLTAEITGSTITGTASIPSGDTVSVTMPGGTPVKLGNGSFSIPVSSGLGSAPVTNPTIRVSPGAVRAGGTVKLSGTVPAGSKVGTTVTLMSVAFPAAHKVSGIPAITTKVTSGGKFSTTVKVPSKTQASTYGVIGRVGKQYLQAASLKVGN
jgi:hypothetical protein